tara:strand:- start:11 stop:1021 length:1011 start_codon:yes stop_codon:yes gene_type:complete
MVTHAGIKMKLLLQCTAILFLASCSTGTKKEIIAHRSASGYLPEHTLEAASMAYAWNVDFIEPDVVMTKDDHLVILHDHHLDTTTNVAQVFPKRSREDGRYYAIDFTLKELKKLRVHERIDLNTKKKVFPNRFELNKSKFEIPTMVEFIELVQGLNKTTGSNIGIYPEIKKPEFHLSEGKDITKALITLLRKYNYEESGNIYIQSFWPNTLKRLRNEFKTSIPLVQLIASNSWNESSADYEKMLTDEGLREISTYANAIGPWLSQLYKKENGKLSVNSVVQVAHINGLKVHPYTHRLEQIPEDMSNEEFLDFIFNDLKVDGLFSDYADLVKNHLRN